MWRSAAVRHNRSWFFVASGLCMTPWARLFTCYSCSSSGVQRRRLCSGNPRICDAIWLAVATRCAVGRCQALLAPGRLLMLLLPLREEEEVVVVVVVKAEEQQAQEQQQGRRAC